MTDWLLHIIAILVYYYSVGALAACVLTVVQCRPFEETPDEPSVRVIDGDAFKDMARLFSYDGTL